jgi:hypothetical protein
MKRQVTLCLMTFALVGAFSAMAQEEQSQQQESATGGAGTGMQQVDMSKMGPWTRKPTNEAQTRKEIQGFLKEEDALMKKKDLEGMLSRIDFPIFMATDDSKGVPKAMMFNRQQYEDTMRPFFENAPQDMQMQHRPTITILSDSLAVVADDFTMTVEGKKRSGKNFSLLVKKDGQWKWKSVVEPGWGDMPTQGVGGAGFEEEGQMEQPEIQYRQ